MSEKIIFRFVHNEARRRAAEYCMTAPEGSIAEFKDATRTLEQNSAQWPILTEFARQKKWSVNGELCWLTADEWKDILTAAYKKEQVRLAQGIDGGVVMLGKRTSKFSKKEFSEWLEYLHYCSVRFEVKLKYE